MRRIAQSGGRASVLMLPEIGIRGNSYMLTFEDGKVVAQREIEGVVAALFDSITDQLAQGGRVELRGFGAFSTRSRDARVGRNPRTGAAVDVSAKRVPYFKPGKEMRERLNLGEVGAE